MDHPTPPPPRRRTRGSADNPRNRFERLAYEADPDLLDSEDGPELPPTVYLRDPSKQALSFNDSPDLPFRASINPYRGCEHGCSYCLSPDTLVLYANLSWRPIGEVRTGDLLLGFDEYPEPGRPRKLRPSRVERLWWSRQPTVKMTTESCDVTTTADHRWLQNRFFRWSRTDQLAPGRLLRRLPVVPLAVHDDDYRVGYVAGLSLGDGTYRYEPGQRSDRLGYPQAYWRIALTDREPLARTAAFLRKLGIEVTIRPFCGGQRAPNPLEKLETRSIPKLARLHPILTTELSTPSYRRGFLAGFFDAEGHSGSSLRISQVDLEGLERVRKYGEALGFQFQLELGGNRTSTLRLVGSMADRLRFFSTCRPAIRRKWEVIFGHMPPTSPEKVEAIEAAPSRDVVDIQTSTRTFYAAGLSTHNCYARPTHEYLGFSAGLDFEARILVKEELPQLLRKAFASPRWQPQVVALSGVTDAYQPIERRTRLTRRCLEVFAEFRNPVAVVTKSSLVVRDADLLAELAGHDAVRVYVSITSLDPALQRAMEPRSAAPAQRLRAVEALAKAGIPVGVMVAPVIPGLTDHEVPTIVEAAARAGARTARHLMLRLPYGNRELFEAWLERHYPERRQKVMNRVRAMRGGKLNDARFHVRMRGTGLFADQTHAVFALACRRAGLSEDMPEVSTAAFRRPPDPQLALFERP